MWRVMPMPVATCVVAIVRMAVRAGNGVFRAVKMHALLHGSQRKGDGKQACDHQMNGRPELRHESACRVKVPDASNHNAAPAGVLCA